MSVFVTDRCATRSSHPAERRVGRRTRGAVGAHRLGSRNADGTSRQGGLARLCKWRQGARDHHSGGPSSRRTTGDGLADGPCQQGAAGRIAIESSRIGLARCRVVSESRACRQSDRRCATPFSQRQASASAACLSVNKCRACRAESLCCGARPPPRPAPSIAAQQQGSASNRHFDCDHRFRPDGLEHSGRPAAEIVDCGAAQRRAGGCIG